MATTSNFRIILKHPESSNNSKETPSFWDAFYDAADQVRGEFVLRPENKVLEGRIKKVFPLRLKHYLSTISTPSLTIGSDSKANIAASITIAVDYLKEGSLDIGLIIEPVEKLAQLFDNNFNYFEVFLRSYVPISFLDALQPEYKEDFIGWRNVVNQFEIDTIPTSEFQTRFQASSAKAVGKSNQENLSLQKAKWLWIASNTSLLVPVLVASVFLYFAHKDVQTRQVSIDKQYQEVLLQKNLLIDQLLKSITTDTTKKKEEPTK